MRKGLVVAVAVLALGMGGCALLDWFTGVKSDGTLNPQPPSSFLGTLLNAVLPGAGVLLTGAAGVYAEVRRRKWRDAAVSTFRTIEAVGATELGADALKKLKNKLADGHKAANVLDTVAAGLKAIGAAPKETAPTTL